MSRCRGARDARVGRPRDLQGSTSDPAHAAEADETDRFIPIVTWTRDAAKGVERRALRSRNPMPDTVIDLIRHGEPEGGQMIRGNHIDHPLSVLGWHQMREAVSEADGWDLVVSSPMARCRPFAAEIAGRFKLPLIVEPRLHEIHMGAWEGMRRAEVAVAHPEDYLAFCRDTVAHRPPGGERLEALIARVSPIHDRLLAHYPGRRMLVVCHAGVARAILCHVLGADPLAWSRLRIDYAGLSRIRHGRFGPTVDFINARRIR